ncbi:MAG: hypothetical protein V3U14_02495 [candidate division NC10 bacterium]
MERVLTQLGVEIRIDPIDEELNSKGGLCAVNGKALLIVDRRLDVNEKNNLMIQSVRAFDIEGIYVKPYIREVIEGGSTPL